MNKVSSSVSKNAKTWGIIVLKMLKRKGTGFYFRDSILEKKP